MSRMPRPGMETGLVSCEWLKAELDAPSGPLKLVEATWYMPKTLFGPPEGSEGPQGDFMKGPRLPGAGFFDIDGVAAADTGLPHMLPDEETFAAAMAALGIEPGTRVVAYDRLGVFSSPRFWYTLKVAFGHPAEVAVLDGGLPRWKELGYPLEEGLPEPSAPAKMCRWSKVPEAVWDKSQVLANIHSKQALHLDARPVGRFHGEQPEPRPKLRWGHVPGSVSLEAVALLKLPYMLNQKDLQLVVEGAGIKLEHLRGDIGPRILTSCGSGMTACILGLGLHQLGMPLSRWSVYDASWCEWGADQETPIVKRGADGAEEAVPPLTG